MDIMAVCVCVSREQFTCLVVFDARRADQFKHYVHRRTSDKNIILVDSESLKLNGCVSMF